MSEISLSCHLQRSERFKKIFHYIQNDRSYIMQGMVKTIPNEKLHQIFYGGAEPLHYDEDNVV